MCLDIGKVIIKDIIFIQDLKVNADLVSIGALLTSCIGTTLNGDKEPFLEYLILWGISKPIMVG